MIFTFDALLQQHFDTQMADTDGSLVSIYQAFSYLLPFPIVSNFGKVGKANLSHQGSDSYVGSRHFDYKTS